MQIIKNSLKALLICLCIIQITYAKPIKITFWHSMAGQLGVVVNRIVAQFNQSQSEYQVVPIYKGNYPQTLTSTVAAFRAGQQPDMVQIFEVGTATMVNPPGAIVPVYKIMQQAGIDFPETQFIPAIGSYYSNAKGQLLAMPFNSSTPVMYLNDAAFKRARLNPNKPPKTWPELKRAALTLLRSGQKCGFTTGWPSWIQLEAFSAWQNVPFATADNGFAGLNARLIYNNPIVIRHITALKNWEQQKIFVYGGRQDNAQALFTSGKCPILMESSGSRADLIGQLPFHVSVAAIPYDPTVKDAPQNMLIGGGAIWVMSRHNPQIYAGVAKFLQFLASAKIQLQWSKATGYLPVTKSGYALAKQSGYYRKNPGAEVAIKELMLKPPTNNSRGIRLGGYSQIRVINNEALEAILSKQKTVKQGLQDAITHGNFILRQFQENVEVSKK
ncbi:MAG: sn-glycerol-3-phosphate ABC transporter substrate-binding protein UgpB [Pseudomonadota bacterium]